MQYLIMLSALTFLGCKYRFWANFMEKNLVDRLIQICRTQRWNSLFQFPNGNTPFGWSKQPKLLV